MTLLLAAWPLLQLKVAELLLDVSEPKSPAREMKVAELFERFSVERQEGRIFFDHRIYRISEDKKIITRGTNMPQNRFFPIARENLIIDELFSLS